MNISIIHILETYTHIILTLLGSKLCISVHILFSFSTAQSLRIFPFRYRYKFCDINSQLLIRVMKRPRETLPSSYCKIPSINSLLLTPNIWQVLNIFVHLSGFLQIRAMLIKTQFLDTNAALYKIRFLFLSSKL